jgi:poly(ADP-ribose) glycohydrolase ARH3
LTHFLITSHARVSIPNLPCKNGADNIDEELLRKKFIGALLGTAVGDALGMPVESWTHKKIDSRYGHLDKMVDGWMLRGHYTDDTRLMIGVAESLIECKGFSGRQMAAQFMDNFEAFRGYGPGSLRVFQRLMYGVKWDEAGKHIYGAGSYGNGGAMRIAPVGVLYHNRPDVLIEVALNSGKITHTHPLGLEGALLQAYAVGLSASTDPLLLGQFDKIEFINALSGLVEEDYYHVKLKKIIEYLEMDELPVIEDVIHTLGVGVRAQDSVPMALYCFLAKCDSFSDAVSYAVNMGGDTDTIGAMTGAIAGALHGFEIIPEQWVQSLENRNKGKDHIIDLGEKLYTLFLTFQ